MRTYPPMQCIFFEVHCSKLKPDPICHLAQAPVLSIPHCVFFFRVCEYPFNCLFSSLFMLALVKHSAFRGGCRFRNFLFLRQFRSLKRFLAVIVSFFVDFFHQLLFVGLCRLRHRLFYSFLQIRVCFYMRSVYKYRFG